MCTRHARRIASLCAAAFALLQCLSANAQIAVAALSNESIHETRSRLQSMAVPVSSSALIQYAAQGDIAVVSLLIKAGLPVTTHEPLHLVTALHNAAAQGHLKLSQQLIDGGADVNAADINGMTPLINAVYGGHLELAKLLLKHQANPATVPRGSPTALNLAIQRGDMPMFDMLLKSSAPTTLADVYGQTPLMLAQRLKRVPMADRLPPG